MAKTAGLSRVSRRNGTKSPRLCPQCNRRIKQWKWQKHLKLHVN